MIGQPALALALWLATLGAVAVPGRASADARVVLERTLRQQYPEVQHWSIKAISRLDEQSGRGPASSKIVRLGARSAVVEDGRLRWFAVAGTIRVWTVTGAVANSTPGSRLGVMPSERNIFSLTCDPWLGEPPGDEMESTRRIGRGDVLCATDLRQRLAVHRGSTIDVVVRGDAVLVRARAVALTSGRTGDHVLVANRETGMRYAVAVTGDGAAGLDRRTKP